MAQVNGYGGFWRRVLIYGIDLAMVFLVAALMGAVVGLASVVLHVPPQQLRVFSGLLGFVVGLLYFPMLESSEYGATFGKMWLGMRVVDEDGEQISFGQALVRYVAKVLSGLLLGFGFLIVGWTPRKRGLHDMIAGTTVVLGR